MRPLNFINHPSIELDDLLRLDDPGVLYEGEFKDSDGVTAYLYTVVGWLEGRPIGEPDHATRSIKGCLVGGDCIVVHAENRGAADAMAADGLMQTIDHHRTKVLSEAVDRSLNQGIIVTTEMPRRKQ